MTKTKSYKIWRSVTNKKKWSNVFVLTVQIQFQAQLSHSEDTDGWYCVFAGRQVGGGRLKTLAALAHQMSAVAMDHIYSSVPHTITEWGTYRGLQPIRWPPGCALFKINNWNVAKRQSFFVKCIRTEKESISFSWFLSTFIQKGLDDEVIHSPEHPDEQTRPALCAHRWWKSDCSEMLLCISQDKKKQHFLLWFVFLVDSPHPCTKSVTIHL